MAVSRADGKGLADMKGGATTLLGAGEARRDATNKQLLERFVSARDQAAFAGLVDRHGSTVWSVCRRLLPREQDAEDAFQAVFLILARRAASIRKREAVGSWLYGVAYKTAMRARRNAARRRACEKQVTPRTVDQAAGGALVFREMQRLLDEELQRLPEKYRAPFVLCCLEGVSRTEAAGELGCKEGTLSARLARARKLLQLRLARRGITLSAVLTIGAVAQGSAQAAPPAILVQGTVQAALAPSAAATPSAVALADAGCRALPAAGLKVVVTAVLVLSALMAGTAFAALTLSPAAPRETWPPRPFPAGWAEEHGVGNLVAVTAGQFSPDAAPPGQGPPPPADVAHKPEYRAKYRQLFRKATDNLSELELYGLDAEQGVRFEEAGLRIILPPGYPDERPRTGIATRFGVQGDFDISLSYDLLQEPDASAAAKQTRLTVALPLTDPNEHFATLSRTVMPGRGPSFLAMQSWRDKQAPLYRQEVRPAKTRSGRLRLVRTGAVLCCYVADGPDGDYALLDRSPFDSADVKEVRIVGSTGGVKAGLDVRITDLQILADSFRAGPRAEGDSLGSKPWLVRALVLIMVLLLGLGFVVNVVRRRCPGNRRSGAAPEAPANARLPPRRTRRWLLATSLTGFAAFLVSAFLLWFQGDPGTTTQEATGHYLNRPFGGQPVSGIQETGLWQTEFTRPSEVNHNTREPFRWTNGNARFVVPVGDSAPQAMTVRLGAPIPRAVKRLWIKVNGESLFDQGLQMPYDWSRTFDLSHLATGQEVLVEIISDTFLAAGDDRVLGVCVRGITLVPKASN